ncbi:DUF502 domain-containing protein [Zestomonas thermotolerans]|uniref:DUF502 domain-containing protein n=1 Tax=Zestomonas thermotolerans TaxID=157784 RepID=UPI0004876107|nr:DUF502 domain-containing protein [Pseudomonas thermotolerans]MBO2511618.1 DUF502 domain-containing protein [Gammaproteobacteria bacterium]
MLKKGFNSLLTTWLTGLLVLLPLTLTLILIAWLFGLINSLVGPATPIGRMFAALGQPFAHSPSLSYLLGTLILLAAIYAVGLAVQLGLRRPLRRVTDLTLRRIPVFNKLYTLAERFVALLDKREGVGIEAMSPVWCFFGGQGAAVLALLPNPEPVEIDGRAYFAVLVPTAPIPVGGGLLYVPCDWVKPANMGIEAFTSIYVSMGITPPAVAPVKEAAVPEQAPLRE